MNKFERFRKNSQEFERFRKIVNYDIKLIFCKLKEAKKRGFDCLQAQNAQNAWISFFASLKKSQKT